MKEEEVHVSGDNSMIRLRRRTRKSQRMKRGRRRKRRTGQETTARNS